MSSDGTRRVRASDAEREEFATRVRTAMTEGRLTLPEGEERLASVYATTYRDELPQFVDDLPGAEPNDDPVSSNSAGRPGDGTFRGAYRGRTGRRPLIRHATVLLVVGAMLVGLWAVTTSGFFWPAIPLIIMAIGFAKHVRWRYTYALHGSRGQWGHRGRCHPHGGWGRHWEAQRTMAGVAPWNAPQSDR